MRSNAAPGVKMRLQDAQRQSWTILSFFLRTPLRLIVCLRQCGRAPGGLFVCGAVAEQGESETSNEVSEERTTGLEFWKVRQRILEGCVAGRGCFQVAKIAR